MTDDIDDPGSAHLPAVQPDPMLKEQRAGPIATSLTVLAATAIVVLVFYGLTHSRDESQMAARDAPNPPAASAATAAPASPSTTGQGASQEAAPQRQADEKDKDPGSPSTQQQNKGQQSQASSSAPAPGSSSTGTVGGPAVKTAPQPAEKAPSSQK